MNTATPELYEVVAKFYEAAVQPEIWPDALDLTAAAFNARGAILPGAQLSEGSIPHSRAMVPVLEQFFAEGWHLRDERTIAAQRHDLARDLATDQFLFQPEEIAKSAYYDGFARSAGVPWFCAAALSISGPGDYVALSLQRSAAQGAFEAEDLARLRLLLPHLRNAMGLALRLAQAQATGVMEGLDIGGTAALIVSASGRVLASNASFARQNHPGLRIRDGHLRAGLAAQQNAVAALIAASAGAVAQMPAQIGPLILRDGDGGSPLVLRAAPWRANPGGAVGIEGVLLTMTALSAPLCPREELLRQLFGLTPREAEIMVMLGQNREVSAIADLLEISRDTVRFHLKAVLSKTGTHRQSEVVALCLRLAERAAPQG